MSIKGLPFDADWIPDPKKPGEKIPDRVAFSADIADYFGRLSSNGISLKKGESLGRSLLVEVSPEDPSKLVINTGFFFINGRFGNVYEPEILQSSPGGAQPRIDSVVLELNTSVNERRFIPRIIEGAEASNPVPPALTRTSDVYQIGLCNIYREPSVVDLGVLEDTRELPDRCGISSVDIPVGDSIIVNNPDNVIQSESAHVYIPVVASGAVSTTEGTIIIKTPFNVNSVSDKLRCSFTFKFSGASIVTYNIGYGIKANAVDAMNCFASAVGGDTSFMTGVIYPIAWGTDSEGYVIINLVDSDNPGYANLSYSITDINIVSQQDSTNLFDTGKTGWEVQSRQLTTNDQFVKTIEDPSQDYRIERKTGEVLLWENSDLHKSWTSKYIPIDLSPYKHIRFEYANSTNNTTLFYDDIIKVGKSRMVTLQVNLQDDITTAFLSRRVTAKDNRVTIDYCKSKTGLTGTPVTKSDYMIPNKVIGLRGTV